jgi:hypothetical protein
MYAVLVSLMLCNDSESGTSPCLQSNQVEKPLPWCSFVSWSVCKQSDHAELRCTMAAAIALHAASLVSFRVAYLQLPFTIMSPDKWVQE